MWREIATNQVFWSTVAGASTALLIAVVLEARTGRELLDQQDAEANGERLAALATRERAWADWKSAWQLHEEGRGPDPGDTPQFLEPVPPANPVSQQRMEATSNRVAALLTGLWALAAALLASLVLVSPAGYPGDFLAALGIVATLLLVVGGVVALLYATTTRITNG